MNSPIIVPHKIIHATLNELQRAGNQHSERVILWLAKSDGDAERVHETLVPIQVAEQDFFRIPRQGVMGILQRCRETGLRVAAQVHSHPREAFHSHADDTWAIVRHIGALSLVVPDFALRTNPESFVADTVVFRLSPRNQWIEIASADVHNYYRFMP